MSQTLDLFSPSMAAEITRSRGIVYPSASRASGRYAGPLANTGVPNKRVHGSLIERRRPFEAVALLESEKRPLRFRACYAVEGTVVEPDRVQLYLGPPDVVFREMGRIQPMMGRFRRCFCNVIGVCRKVQSGASDPQRQ